MLYFTFLVTTFFLLLPVIVFLLGIDVSVEFLFMSMSTGLLQAFLNINFWLYQIDQRLNAKNSEEGNIKKKKEEN